MGLTILQKLRAEILKRKWLSKQQINDGIALVQFYPGPTNFDFVAYTGFQLHGVLGALLAVIGFLIPSFQIMLLLSWAYFSFANLGWMPRVMQGLEASSLASLPVSSGIWLSNRFTRFSKPQS